MTIQRILPYDYTQPLPTWPTEDGPAYAIPFPDNSPGWRGVKVYENTFGDDSIVYLLEVTAVSSTNNIARTHKLYKFNLLTKNLTYVHTVTGLPDTGMPYQSILWPSGILNANIGYYTINYGTDANYPNKIYVIDLETGTITSTIEGCFHSSVHANNCLLHKNKKDFYVMASTSTVYNNLLRVRSLIVDEVTKSITSDSIITSAASGTTIQVWPLSLLYDKRSGADENNMVAIGWARNNSGPLYYCVPSVTSTATNTAINNFAYYAQITNNMTYNVSPNFFSDTQLYGGGQSLANFSWYPHNYTGTALSYGTLTNWGTCAAKPFENIMRHYDFDTGNYGNTMVMDNNADVYTTKVEPANGVFGAAKFRATFLVPNMSCVLSCITKRGAFVCGQVANTTTNAPVIFYYLAS